MFISLGLNAGMYEHSANFNQLIVIDELDPNFGSNIANALKPNFGFGLFLYTRKFHLGLSCPRILNLNYQSNDGATDIYATQRHYYLTTGYGISVTEDFVIKPSAAIRYVDSGTLTPDYNLQFMYKKLFWIGASYRHSSAMAFLLNVQPLPSLAVTYSYDNPINASAYYKKGTHEVTLSFEYHGWFRRNKDRRFLKKKVDEDDNEGVRSIRYF